MTKEQAINYLKYLKIIGFSENQINEIVKALEQQPILDKIRADVINIADGRQSIKVRSVLKIIDKYRK